YLIRDVLGAFVLGAAIAFLIQPAIHRLTELGLPRILAIGLIFVVILLALAGIVLLVLPLFIGEVGQLQSQAPSLANEAQRRITELQGSPVSIFGFNVNLSSSVETVSSHLRDYLLGQFGNAVSIGLTALTTLLQILLMFVGALPAVLVGLASGGPFKALLVVGLYFLISNVILNFVYPKVMGDAVRLPPLLVIVALIAGFSWAGILGMFVAVPLAATLRIVFDHIYPRLYEQKPA